MTECTEPTAAAEDIWVVIPAAGVGKRMQSETPKQYLPLGSMTVLEQTLSIFLKHPRVAGIVVVTSSTDTYWPAMQVKLQAIATKPIYTALGGAERADSVLSALVYLRDSLALDEDVVVLVHDAARPCVSQRDLAVLIAHAKHATTGVVLAMPVRDTMKRAKAGTQRIAHTENRVDLWHALTPQLASLGVLHQALSEALTVGASITDEASALELLGLQPYLVAGSANNIKITHPSDLALAALWLQAQALSTAAD